MNQPLLSVVVPCYKVEKYLDKCISSIVGQKYANLEILLIDDGSPDNCGMICDAWQDRDSRIRVIHKLNEGLAYARKTGVENATADYVTFVDGDDWIDEDMYANMMTALLNTGSDIAQCGVCMVYEKDGRKKHRDSEVKTSVFEVIGRIEGALLIIENNKWHSWMWNKIFKKYLFEGIVFPKGRGYAEDFIALYLFHKANQSVYTLDEYCYYLQRSDSYTGSKDIKNQLKNHCDFLDALYERYLFVAQHTEYHSILPKVKLWTLRLGIQLLRNIIALPEHFTDDYFYEKAKLVISIPLTSNDKLQRGLKIEYYVLKYAGARCYKFFRRLYNKRLKPSNQRSYTLLEDFWGCFLKDTLTIR
jgi:glycosyltransferase involved in cell wall biosynthesis